jgi:hypothetical protein
MVPSEIDEPTMDVLPAGEAFGLSRATTYRAIANGTFPVPVFKAGGTYKAATAEVRRRLGLPLASAEPAPPAA